MNLRDVFEQKLTGQFKLGFSSDSWEIKEYDYSGEHKIFVGHDKPYRNLKDWGIPLQGLRVIKNNQYHSDDHNWYFDSWESLISDIGEDITAVKTVCYMGFTIFIKDGYPIGSKSESYLSRKRSDFKSPDSYSSSVRVLGGQFKYFGE